MRQQHETSHHSNTCTDSHTRDTHHNKPSPPAHPASRNAANIAQETQPDPTAAQQQPQQSHAQEPPQQCAQYTQRPSSHTQTHKHKHIHTHTHTHAHTHVSCSEQTKRSKVMDSDWTDWIRPVWKADCHPPGPEMRNPGLRFRRQRTPHPGSGCRAGFAGRGLSPGNRPALYAHLCDGKYPR